MRGDSVDWEETAPVVAMLAVVVFAVACFVYAMHSHEYYGEISIETYQEDQKWVKEFPVLASTVAAEAPDGKITPHAQSVIYAKYRELASRAERDRLKKAVQMADK